MNNNNPNDLATVVLCTNMGDQNSRFNPLTNLQYNQLSTMIYNSLIKSPSTFLENKLIIKLHFKELL